jgi:hypothetical protein
MSERQCPSPGGLGEQVLGVGRIRVGHVGLGGDEQLAGRHGHAPQGTDDGRARLRVLGHPRHLQARVDKVLVGAPEVAGGLRHLVGGGAGAGRRPHDVRRRLVQLDRVVVERDLDLLVRALRRRELQT